MYKSGKLKALLIILVLAVQYCRANQLLQPHDRLREIIRSASKKSPSLWSKIGIFDNKPALLKFNQTVNAFLEDAYFQGTWTISNFTATELFNGFVNTQGDSISYFKVFDSDPADNNTTQIFLWYNDEVEGELTPRNTSIRRVRTICSTLQMLLLIPIRLLSC